MKSMSTRFFEQFDMFYSPPTLRTKDKPQVSNTFAGGLSFILTLFFAYVFIVKTLQIFDFEEIDGQQSNITINGEDAQGNNLMFAFSINFQNISVFKGIFEFQIERYNHQQKMGQVIEMQSCRIDHWTNLSIYAKSKYNETLMQNFICPKIQANRNIKQTFTMKNYQQIIMRLNPCLNTTQSSNCLPQDNQTAFINNLVDQNRYVAVWMYIFDQSANMYQQVPLQSFITTKNKLAFTANRGIETSVELGSFFVRTDKGILPWEEYVYHTGNFIDKINYSDYEISTFGIPYTIVQFVMNHNQIFMKRRYGKLDDTLSYAGGLFTMIIGFLVFFMNAFNEYRFELLVAQGAFNYNDDGKKILEADFRFHNYIKYCIFDWINALCCCRLTWEACAQIDRTRREAIRQMDVSRIFKKIQNIQTDLLNIISINEKICLSLIEPPSMHTARRERLIQDYYHKIIGGKNATTIQDITIQNQILKIGIQLANKEGISINPQNFVKSRKNILQIAFNVSPEIIREANQVQLNEEFLQIEKYISKCFCSMKPEVRDVIQQRIPIKILHRLRKQQTYVDSTHSFEILI